MSDESALLAAIIAHPGEDTPRLIYADWLDEHNQPVRADFIRIQVRLAAASVADPDYPDLLERHAEVIVRLGSKPHLNIPKLPEGFAFDSDSIGIVDFKRGFISSIRGTWMAAQRSPTREEIEQFAAGLQQLVTTTTVRHLGLYGLSPDQLARVLTAPGAELLEGMLLSHNITDIISRSGDGLLRAIATSKATALERLFFFFHLSMPTNTGFADLGNAKLDRLTQLGLWLQTGSECDLAPLTKAKWFRNLRSVHFSDSAPRGSLFVPALAELPHLESLYLMQQSTQAKKALSTARGFPALTCLHLIGRTPFNDALRMAKGKFPRLAELSIRGEGNADDAVLRFCDAKWWGQIRVLELGGGWITDEAIKALARSPIAPGLRILRLHQHAFGTRALLDIADGARFPNLTTLELDLSSASKHPSTMATTFAKRLSLPRLRHLSLAGYPLGDEGAKSLATNPALATLTRLMLRNCGIGEKGLTAIVRSPYLQQLIELDVRSNKLITATALCNPSLLPQLAVMRVEFNAISASALQKLTDARARIT